MLKDLSEIIEIDTSDAPPVDGAPFGPGNRKALDWFLEKASLYGLRTGNDEGYSAWAEYGSGETSIGILCHLDTVPAGEGWSTDPLVLTEADGNLYGRGVSDDKGPAVACLHVLKNLKEKNIPLRHRVRLIVGFNEECGSECIKHYVKKNEIPVVSFTPDADFPVVASEKGILHFNVVSDAPSFLTDAFSGERPNIVPDAASIKLNTSSVAFQKLLSIGAETEKKLNECGLKSEDFIIRPDGTVTASGTAAHGAKPELGDNAAYKLLALMYALNPSDRAYFLMKAASKDGPEYLGINKEDESGKLTLNTGMMRLSDGKLILTMDVRRPVSISENDVLNSFDGKFGISVSVIERHQPLFYSDNNPLIETLLAVYRKETGDNDSAPLRIGGGTYAKELPNCCGFGACPPGLDTKMHEPNEFLPKELFEKLPRIYLSAILELDKVF